MNPAKHVLTVRRVLDFAMMAYVARRAMVPNVVSCKSVKINLYTYVDDSTDSSSKITVDAYLIESLFYTRAVSINEVVRELGALVL